MQLRMLISFLLTPALVVVMRMYVWRWRVREKRRLLRKYPKGFPNYYSGDISEEEAEEAWGINGIANDFDDRMESFPDCMVPRWADFMRPLPQVVKDHPNENPFCFWGYHGDWMTPVAWMQQQRSYDIGDAVAGREDGPFVTVYPADDPPLEMHVDVYNRNVDNDDLYCHAMGWLRGQGLNGSLIKDFDAWKALSEEECAKIAKEYPNFTDRELSMWNHANGWGRTMWRCGCSAGFRHEGCARVTKREFKVHAYHKCVMKEAGFEMSYCYQRACLLPGNRIGHQTDCDELRARELA